ncbi:hypothetical protein TNIN_313351 [Trichonephila inaurata madagascariensis]|uniref:Uncharacterized protein n=1 Tax=Trichonephila inaurata madagascariensis TaxID=2747483 RepID=A0A8X6XS81_9ARAC|nr:hypothetical protein TNIN_313351 [Trichonephila inaurata madagascariensis]
MTYSIQNFSTPSEQNTDHLSGPLKESLVDTSEKSCSNEKGDSLNFTNADFKIKEPDLIEIFKNPIAMNHWLPDLFNEKYDFFPILTNDTQDVAIAGDSKIVETSKVSTPNKYLENLSEKNPLHDAIFVNSKSTTAVPEESKEIQVPNNSEENAIHSKKQKKKENFQKGCDGIISKFSSLHLAPDPPFQHCTAFRALFQLQGVN